MKLAELIIRAFENELTMSSRRDRRDFNKGLEEAKWLIAYPSASDTTLCSREWAYDRISFAFSNDTPEFIYRGSIDAIEQFAYDDDLRYWCTWKEIAVHMSGTIWIETSRFKPAYIEPVSFEHLETLPCLNYDENEKIHQAVTDYLGVSEDFEVDAILEKYLNSLPKDELRIEIVFDDVEQRNYYEFGTRTVVIYYKNEVIAYASFCGRELLSKKFFTKDIKKYQAAMKDIVDKSGVYDKMVFNGVTVVSTEDADLFVGVPGITPTQF